MHQGARTPACPGEPCQPLPQKVIGTLIGAVNQASASCQHKRVATAARAARLGERRRPCEGDDARAAMRRRGCRQLALLRCRLCCVATSALSALLIGTRLESLLRRACRTTARRSLEPILVIPLDASDHSYLCRRCGASRCGASRCAVTIAVHMRYACMTGAASEALLRAAPTPSGRSCCMSGGCCV